MLELTYHTGEVCRNREVELDKALASHPDIKFVKNEVRIPGYFEDGAQYANAWLASHPAGKDNLAIWGCWDDPAIGAIGSLRAQGRTDVKVYGVNGNAQALENIQKGFMTATAFQDSYTEGYNMIKLLPEIVKAGANWQPKAIEVPAILVTKENIEKFLADHPVRGEVNPGAQRHGRRATNRGRQRRPPLVSANAISKAFGGAQALRGVSLSILPGEVHGLVGANGAGKSTLIRILAGLTQPDSGEIVIDGRRVAISSPHLANELGMSFIHQELAFVPGMTVLENIMLGLPKKTRFGVVDWPAIARDIAPIAKRVGVRAPLSANVNGLSTAENWLINITRALVRNARLIVMDEPTAALSMAESERLFGIIRELGRSGIAVLYVSHRLDEILELCRRVTVLRDGGRVAELTGAALTRPALVEAIVGGAVESQPEHVVASAIDEIAISVRGVSRAPKVRNVSFDLRKGEVLGLGGLVGAGRSELARMLFGADRPDSGEMRLEGRPFAPRSPSQAVKAGIGFVPEERRAEGLILAKSVGLNLGLANLKSIIVSPMLPLISGRRRDALVSRTIQQLAIKGASGDTPVGRLSGGNQQKVVIGRWLQSKPKVLILDEPTRGVDVGARAEIHRLIRGLARQGMAVLVISSDPEELPDLCDRVLIMAEGRIVGELAGGALTRHAIISASYAGITEQSVA